MAPLRHVSVEVKNPELVRLEASNWCRPGKIIAVPFDYILILSRVLSRYSSPAKFPEPRGGGHWPSTNAVAGFQASAQLQARVAELLRREKNEALDDTERSELSHYLELEHVMRLAKARARERLAHG